MYNIQSIILPPITFSYRCLVTIHLATCHSIPSSLMRSSPQLSPHDHSTSYSFQNTTPRYLTLILYKCHPPQVATLLSFISLLIPPSLSYQLSVGGHPSRPSVSAVYGYVYISPLFLLATSARSSVNPTTVTVLGRPHHRLSTTLNQAPKTVKVPLSSQYLPIINLYRPVFQVALGNFHYK